MQAVNWVVGLLILSTMAVKLHWGADLIAAACCIDPTPGQDLFHDGTLHLGIYLILSGVFLHGALGFILMHRPYEVVPLWFAIPCLFSTAECILAWNFLRPQLPDEDDFYDSD